VRYIQSCRRLRDRSDFRHHDSSCGEARALCTLSDVFPSGRFGVGGALKAVNSFRSSCFIPALRPLVRSIDRAGRSISQTIYGQRRWGPCSVGVLALGMVPSEELSMDCEWHQPFVIWLIISSSSGSVGRPWMTVAEGENLQICKDIPRVPPFKGLRFQFRRSQYVKTTSASALDRLVSPEVPIGTIVTLTEDDLSALLLQSGSEFASAVTCHMCKFEPTPGKCDEFQVQWCEHPGRV